MVPGGASARDAPPDRASTGRDAPALIHESATGFAHAADAYERSRPGYPAPLVASVRERLDLRPGRTVLDLGAGTGKFTRELVATGAGVIAVEPVAEMADHLRAALPDVEVRAGTAEAIPLSDGSVDGATAAQCFHWFDIPRALVELHRVLRAGGMFVVVFNRRRLDTPAQQVMAEVVRPFRGDTPSWQDHRWEQELRETPRFRLDDRLSLPHEHLLTLEDAVQRIRSISFIAKLDEATRADVLDTARRRLAPLADDEGRICFLYDAEATFLARKPQRGDAPS